MDSSEPQNIPEDQARPPLIERDPHSYLLNNIVDALARARYGSSFIELEKKEKNGGRDYEIASRQLSEVIHGAISVTGDIYKDTKEWLDLPDRSQLDFLDWLKNKNAGFKSRYENFERSVDGLDIDLSAADKIDQYNRIEQQKKAKALEVEEVTSKIEDLSETELRNEISRRVLNALGKLIISPVADGSALQGYGRPTRDSSLASSYFRYLKLMNEDEQVTGVQVELFGVFNYHFESFRTFDGPDFKSSNNRYYFIPVDSIQPAVVSTESFIDRANKVNPNFQLENEGSDPSFKIANLQDLRDALAVVRDSDWFIKEVIYNTPHQYWGRSGLTE